MLSIYHFYLVFQLNFVSLILFIITGAMALLLSLMAHLVTVHALCYESPPVQWFRRRTKLRRLLLCSFLLYINLKDLLQVSGSWNPFTFGLCRNIGLSMNCNIMFLFFMTNTCQNITLVIFSYIERNTLRYKRKKPDSTKYIR
mgnify:CR=1 FL=1